MKREHSHDDNDNRRLSKNNKKTKQCQSAQVNSTRRIEFIDSSSNSMEPVCVIHVAETLMDTTQTNSTGLHIWTSSFLLAPLLVDYGCQGLLKGKHLVELGAGTGVVGRAASLHAFGAARVDLTDIDSTVLTSLRDIFKTSKSVCVEMVDVETQYFHSLRLVLLQL